MIHYKQDFIEIDSHSLDRLMNDQARLQFLVDTGWYVLSASGGYQVVNDGRTLFFRQCETWRDAIDEAMRDDEL